MSRRLVGRLKSLLRLGWGGARGYLTEHDVVQQTGASPEELREWERRGLLRPYARTGQNLYQQGQIEVVHWLMREERIRRRHPLPQGGEAPGGAPAATFRRPS
ncbi:MAG TPA: MerR family transcriptional regulator [Candidatus Methylomirabilis sp.]